MVREEDAKLKDLLIDLKLGFDKKGRLVRRKRKPGRLEDSGENLNLDEI